MGTPEIIIVVLVVLLVFGSSWLPSLARKAGRTSVDVEKARKEFETTRDHLKETAGPMTDTVSKINKTLTSSPTDLAKQALATGSASAAADVPAGGVSPEVADEALLAAEAELIADANDDKPGASEDHDHDDDAALESTETPSTESPSAESESDDTDTDTP